MSEKSLNILVINWQDIEHPLAGGAEVHLHEVFGRLAKWGHKVTLLSCSVPNKPKDTVVDGMTVLRRGSRSLFNFVVPFVYFFELRKRHFDIIVVDVNKIPFFTPIFIGKPKVVVAHHFFGKAIFIEANPLVASYVYITEQLFLKLYRRYPFVIGSPSTYKEIKELGVPEEKIELINYCVDHDVYRVLPGGAKAPYPLVGYLGRLKRYKSVDHLIRAFVIIHREIPDARLIIVGNGDNKNDLERLAESLNMSEYIRFTGFVPEDEKVRYLNESWVVVNPSAKEGWGLTVVEANACGTPVVAADSPGLRDAVRNGITGYLYPYGDIDALAEKTVFLLRNDDTRLGLATEGLKWAASFNWDEAAEKLLAILYREVEAQRQ